MSEEERSIVYNKDIVSVLEGSAKPEGFHLYGFAQRYGTSDGKIHDYIALASDAPFIGRVREVGDLVVPVFTPQTSPMGMDDLSRLCDLHPGINLIALFDGDKPFDQRLGFWDLQRGDSTTQLYATPRLVLDLEELGRTDPRWAGGMKELGNLLSAEYALNEG